MCDEGGSLRDDVGRAGTFVALEKNRCLGDERFHEQNRQARIGGMAMRALDEPFPSGGARCFALAVRCLELDEVASCSQQFSYATAGNVDEEGTRLGHRAARFRERSGLGLDFRLQTKRLNSLSGIATVSSGGNRQC